MTEDKLTEDMLIDDDLFSDNDQQDILDFVEKIRLEIDTDDILFEHEPIDATPSAQVEPKPRFDFTDILFKENNKTKRRTAKKIREKYLKMGRNRDKVKRLAQRAIRQLKKSKYLENNDTETIDYNNDIDIIIIIIINNLFIVDDKNIIKNIFISTNVALNT